MKNTRSSIEEANGISGIPVDYAGRPTIDPTKNVLDLVRAESKYQDSQRDSLKELLLSEISAVRDHVKILSDSTVAFQNAQRTAETSRIDQLAQTRQEFQNTIRDMLAESVRTTSTLVSTQLVQIQGTFDTRVGKLEAYQFTQAGKSSVADPVMSDALARLTRDMNEIRLSQDATTAKVSTTLSAIQATENRTGGQTMGRQDSNARLLAVVMAVAAIASPVISILVTIMVMRGHG